MTRTAAVPVKTGWMSGPTVAAFRAEILKTVTLRSWWIGVGAILALNLYYAQMNTTLLVDLSSTLDNNFFVDFDGTVTSFDRAVRDSILASPYQSAALFVPLLIAVVRGQEYRSGQVLVSATAVPSRIRLAGVAAVSTALLGAAVTLVAFVMSDAVLLLLLPAEGRVVVLSAAGLAIALKVTAYAVVMSVVAGALTTLFRNTMPALITIVAILVLAMSGLLSAVFPPLHHLLPMIAAKTFLFGYVSQSGDPSTGAGVAIMLGWLAGAIAAWLLVFQRRDVA